MILSILALIIIIFHNSDAQFRGGTISWAEYTGGKIRFTYRLTWQKGTGPCGPGCSYSDIGKKGSITPNLSSLVWKCTHGCTRNTTMNDINYNMTSISNSSVGWEQGEYLFFNNFVGTGPFEMTLDQVPWTGSGSISGRLTTSINLEVRNDTGLPNVSPVAAVPPYLGKPFGCRFNISLPIEDPDADRIKCRLAKPSECGSACTSLPKIVYLNEDACNITIEATSSNGYRANTDYRVTVMIEDFPKSTIQLGNITYNYNQALSKIPLQFTVRIVSTSQGCHKSEITFAQPTVDDGTRISYPGQRVVGLYKTGFYIESFQNRSENFIVSLPAGMTYSILPDDFGRSNITRLYATWDPTNDQMGDAFYCVWGIDKEGITSEKICVTSMIVDYDECIATPCKNNGTCINLFHRYSCECEHGFSGYDCSKRVTCADNPCKNKGYCSPTMSSYSCHCKKGFSGLNCQQDIDACQSNPCFNGGTCNNLVGRFKCHCPAGYEGSTCNINKESSFTSSRYFWPVVGSVCGFSALLLAAGLGCCIYYFVCIRRPKRETRETSVAPSNHTTDNDRTSHKQTSLAWI